MNDIYRRQVALLIRVMPLVFKIKDFAVHGGTAINLFHRNLPRYSVDIDVTYIPLEDRETSLENINTHLANLKTAFSIAVFKFALSISRMCGNCNVSRTERQSKLRLTEQKGVLLAISKRFSFARKQKTSLA